MGQLCHWGPITALTIIGVVSVVTHGVFLAVHPISPLYLSEADSTIYDLICVALEYTIYLCWHFAILGNYFRAAYLGPGFVPLKWHPSNLSHRQYFQFCEACKGYKPPRAHHCRRCGRCVMKMDHHCPWINTCAGHRNQASFIYFLFFCPLGCLHSLTHLVPVIYHFFYADWYYNHHPEIFMQLVHIPWWFFIAVFLATGLAIGVIGAVGSLFVVQFRQALRNKTSIEEYIISKADWIRERHPDSTENCRYPDFIFPYDLGWKRNLEEVFMVPLTSDYMSWPIKEGCTPFDFTVEQLRQKRVKRDRATPFEICTRYDGRWCPVIAFGWRVACCPPWPDEPLLKVLPGDVINVTRAKGRWLYGELVSRNEKPDSSERDSKKERENDGNLRKRGWFPERAARLIIYTNEHDYDRDSVNMNEHDKEA